MKLESIKALLKGISPWPWRQIGYSTIDNFNGDEIIQITSKLPLEDSSDQDFVAMAPVIVDQLVKENEVMREALNKISNYSSEDYDSYSKDDLLDIAIETIKVLKIAN